jgi:hypothetical protein
MVDKCLDWMLDVQETFYRSCDDYYSEGGVVSITFKGKQVKGIIRKIKKRYGTRKFWIDWEESAPYHLRAPAFQWFSPKSSR